MLIAEALEACLPCCLASQLPRRASLGRSLEQHAARDRPLLPRQLRGWPGKRGRSDLGGMTSAQPFAAANTAVSDAPRAMPMVAPASARRIASARDSDRTSVFVAPRARRRPISAFRLSTPMTIMFAMPMPMPPTRRATRPRPRKRDVSALLAAARAASAYDGRLIVVSSGRWGFAVSASG